MHRFKDIASSLVGSLSNFSIATWRRQAGGQFVSKIRFSFFMQRFKFLRTGCDSDLNSLTRSIVFCFSCSCCSLLKNKHGVYILRKSQTTRSKMVRTYIILQSFFWSSCKRDLPLQDETEAWGGWGAGEGTATRRLSLFMLSLASKVTHFETLLEKNSFGWVSHDVR